MTRFRDLPYSARVFVAAVFGLGLAAAAVAWAAHPPAPTGRTFLLVALAVAGGLIRVPLPVVGRLSLAYPFMFGALMAFGLGASTLAGLLAAAASSIVPVAGRQPLFRGCFNAGLVGIASLASGGVYLWLGGHVGAVEPMHDAAAILAYTLTFAFINLGLIALVTKLSGAGAAWVSLRSNFTWSIPGFLAGSSLAALLGMLLQHQDLSLLLLSAPFIYLLDLAYRTRSERAEGERRHSQQIAELYGSITRALALAIEAKDENTEQHLERVEVFSLGIAKCLRLPPPEIEALRAAALLHDIGKIAVPEYILTKPGKLTAEEMERMRVHPAVGAQILEAVPFPYPLAPIVRHHHERWDGSGYPDRLCGTHIPLGARILSLVDCYDALTSDRPYRRAIARKEAVAFLSEQAGKMFDPELVRILVDQVDELEARVAAAVPGGASPAVLAAPAPPEAHPATDAPSGGTEVAVPSHVEFQTTEEMARIVERSLPLDEKLTLLSAKLARLIPHRSVVVYRFDGPQRKLVALFTAGTAADRLASLEIPLGERLSGWAALQQRAFTGRTHVNPLDRDGSRSDLEGLVDEGGVGELKTAIVAPLSTEQEHLGVIALYDGPDRAYGAEHKRLLLTAAPHIARAIRDSLLMDRVRHESLTDPLTGLPNWRFFHLEAAQRLSRDESGARALGVLAFGVAGLSEVRARHGEHGAQRLLVTVARRLAASCEQRETLARIADDRFVVLTNEPRRSVLSSRCISVQRRVQEAPADLEPGLLHPVRVRWAHAASPDEGATADRLLEILDARLRAPEGDASAVAAFPAGRWTHFTGGGVPPRRDVSS